MFRQSPVLISDQNFLFSVSDYVEIPAEEKKKFGVFHILKKYAPSRSVNLNRVKVWGQLKESMKGSGRTLFVLVVGSGNQNRQIAEIFNEVDVVFVFCDIDKRADVDIVCDAHQLPFCDGVFDGVITTAVLEHVLYPERVVSEMARVVKLGGFIYSEIPFLQSVHEGAYDFTRYTMSGHRRLLEAFEETSAGMIAGPGTALVWSLCDFPKQLFPSPRFSRLVSLLMRYLVFWLKYCDYLVEKNPRALDFASATYFCGNKSDVKTSPESIVQKYGASDFKHT